MNAIEILQLKGPIFLKWTPNDYNMYCYRLHAIIIANLLLCNPGPFHIQYFHSSGVLLQGHRILDKVRKFLDAANVVKFVCSNCIILKNNSKFYCAPYRDDTSLRGIGANVVFIDNPSVDVYQNVLRYLGEHRLIMNIVGFEPSDLIQQLDPDGTIPVKLVSIFEARANLELAPIDRDVFYSKQNKQNDDVDSLKDI